MMLYEFVQKFQRTLFLNLPYLLSRKSKQTKALFTHYYTWYSFHLQLLHLVSMYTLLSYSQDAKVLNKKFVMCNNGWIHNTLVCNERNFVKVNENWNANSKWIWFWRFVGPRCLVCSYYNLHQQVKSHKAKCFNLPQSWENFMPI